MSAEQEPAASVIALCSAIRREASLIDAAREFLRESDDEAAIEHARNIRSAIDLVRSLAKIVEGKSLHEAFGAPGDWGYDTPIGLALYEHYSQGAASHG